MAEQKQKGGKCPVCSKPRDDEFRPFCSKRCADVDLNKWLTGGYAIPLPDEELEDEDIAVIERARAGLTDIKH